MTKSMQRAKSTLHTYDFSPLVAMMQKLKPNGGIVFVSKLDFNLVKGKYVRVSTQFSDYFGSINRNGKFIPGDEARAMPKHTKQIYWKALLEANNDFEKELAAYGRATGICGICARTLTDPESIAAGIGPVCAGKLKGN